MESPDPVRVVVTGASRGIGLEYARQWAAAGRRVFALARDPAGSAGLSALAGERPDRVVPVACDVTDDASVEAARRSVAAATDGIEILVNNAGIGGERGGPEEIPLDGIRRVFETNTLGPLRTTRAFLPLVRAGRAPRRLVHMTSLMGSIEDNGSGDSYAYRISKCALNMASRSLAVDLRDEGIVSVVLHPGWVRTDMGGPDARIGVEEAVASLIATIEGLTMEDSGSFYDREGAPLPY